MTVRPSPLLGTASTAPANAAGAPSLWAIASGKGGVGKSLITANLGCLLAESEWPTAVVDLDLQGANLHTFLGVDGIGPGLERFLRRQVDLPSLLCPHEVPNLSTVAGVRVPGLHLGEAERRRLLKALRGLPVRAVLLDLGTGSSPDVVDCFLAADVPLLVVTPDPASIENAHRFLAGVYLRAVDQAARRVGRAREVRGLGLGERWRPAELEARIGAIDPGWAAELRRRLDTLTVHLVVNQVRHPEDAGIGFTLGPAIRHHFGIAARYVAAIPHDPSVWRAVRRRLLVRRELDDEVLSSGLAALADHVIEGGALRPGDELSWSPTPAPGEPLAASTLGR